MKKWMLASIRDGRGAADSAISVKKQAPAPIF